MRPAPTALNSEVRRHKAHVHAPWPAAGAFAAWIFCWALPSHARACASCFGETGGETSVIKALMLAGGIMLVLVFAILGTAVYGIRRSERRSEEKFRAMGLMKETTPRRERWPFL